MAFETSGSLVTDKQTIETAFAWNTQTEWQAFQSKNNVVIESGILKLAQTFPTTDLEHHYDVTDLTGSDGDPISTLPDKIGSADLVQATSSEQPTLQTNEINGNQVLRFDGDNDIMVSSDFSSILSQPNHVYIVFKLVTLDANDSYLIATNDSGNRHDLFSDNDGGNFNLYAGNALIDGGDDTNPHIFGLLFNGASSEIRRDGSVNVTGNAGSDSYPSISIGGLPWTSVPFMNIDIGEILIYDDELTSTEIADLESYLSEKWGVTI